MNFIIGLFYLLIATMIIGAFVIGIYYVDKAFQWLETKYNEIMDIKNYFDECVERMINND